MTLIKLLLFAGIVIFFVWLCHKADADYIEANKDDMTDLLNNYNFGDEHDL